ncbi:MAG: glycosyltransferase [bacterium]|nr:glycosyltransferase [bacterium]
MNKSIHIIAFDIPFPANYGGVIDVFYRIKALHELGVSIKLHCFSYGNRQEALALEKYCDQVFYYPRKKFSFDILKPYIVSTRSSELLLENLLKDEDPILFEAIHSCYYLNHPKLSGRFKMVRMHNIEHDYYELLARSEPKFLQRTYYEIESILLRRYESILNHADVILTISHKDKNCLQTRFGNRVKLLPAFHGNTSVNSKLGRGDYCFYHGKLSVAENNLAAIFLVKEVFSLIKVPFIIAGDGISSDLRKAIMPYDHIKLIEGIGPEEINDLIQNAHINVLPTFQPTGIKLKLVNVLFQGRFMLANTHMVNATGLEDACIIEDNPIKMSELIVELMKRDFKEDDLSQRRMVLGSQFNVLENAKMLIELLP